MNPTAVKGNRSGAEKPPVPTANPSSFTFEVGLPYDQLSPNKSVRWKAKAKIIQVYRKEVAWAAKAAMPQTWDRNGLRYAVILRFFFATNRRRDEDNALSSMKAGFDGMSDAGLWLDDSRISPRVAEMGRDKARPRVEVTVMVAPPEGGNLLDTLTNEELAALVQIRNAFARDARDGHRWTCFCDTCQALRRTARLASENESEFAQAGSSHPGYGGSNGDGDEA